MASQEIDQFLKDLRTSDVTIYGEKMRKLNLLTRRISENLKGNLDEADKLLLSLSDSPDFYSKRTRLELANALQRPAFVLEALRSEDKVLIERALQFSWIFSGPTSILTLNGNNDLVQSVFPSISFSCRKQLIHRLSKYGKDEKRLESVYRAIEEKYGIALAIPLLPACSEPFIQDMLMTNNKVQLSSRQLQQILERYPSLAVAYLEKFYGQLWKERESNKYLINNTYRVALSRLVKLLPDQFMNLFEKYGDLVPELCLGPRLTKVLLGNKDYLERILGNGSKYARVLHQQETMKRLDTEKFRRFFTSLLPSSITSFQVTFEIGQQGYRGERDSLFVWLKKFPKEKRFEVLSQSFEEVYQKKLLDFPEFVTSRLIQLLTAEERDKWVDTRLSLPDGHSQFLYHSVGFTPICTKSFWEAFRATSQSIPTLKGLLATEADMHRRSDLISNLVLSCSINNDVEALKDICQHVVTRFRNDNIIVRTSFLNALVARFDIMNMDDNLWGGLDTPINELLQISFINNEFSQSGVHILRILERSIYHHLLKNLPVESQIQNYIKIQTRSYCWGESWNILIKYPDLEKKCLTLFAENLPQVYPTGGPFPSNSSLTAGIISMAESISGYNRRHPKDKISSLDFTWLASRLHEILVDSVDERNKTRLVIAFQRDPRARDKYFPVLIKSNPLPTILLHFLRTSPELIASDAEHILPFILRTGDLSSYAVFLKALQYQGHTTISDNFLRAALDIIEDDEEILRLRIHAMKIIPSLMTTDKFLNLARKYYPEGTQVDTGANDVERTYEMTKAVAYALKNVEQPSKALPVLFEFCKGDYLKLIIGSIYSLCYHSPEKEAIVFLKELVNRPVSVKKHAIRLMTTITNKQNIIRVLKELWETEKNSSIRNILFHKIFQVFLFESSEENWALLNTAIQGLSQADHLTLGSLGSLNTVEHIPDKFLTKYFQCCWQVVDELEKPRGPEVNWALANICQGIANCQRISLVDTSFLRGILDKYLFVIPCDQNLDSHVVYLAIKYLLYHRNDGKEVDLILDCVQKRLTGQSQWNKPDENIITLYPCKQALSTFIEQLCIESFKCPGNLRDDERAKKLMETLVNKLSEVISPAEIFIDRLFLQFSVIFHSGPEVKVADDLIEIGKKVGLLVDELIKDFEAQVIGIISETLKRFLSLCYKYRLTTNEGKIIHVIDGILKSTGSINTQIMAIQVLSSTYPKPHTYEYEYNKLIGELRQIQNKTVQIFVNYRLNQSRPIGYFDMLV